MTPVPDSSCDRTLSCLERLIVGAAFLALCSCATTVPPPERSIDLGFPSPLAGPGQPESGTRQWKLVEEGWQSLSSGAFTRAYGLAAEAATPQAALLEYQIRLAEEADPTRDLQHFAAQYEDYAAAWATLSVAAERSQNESLALSAARRGAELWRRGQWQSRPELLYQRWVDDRAANAENRLADGAAAEALPLLERALELAPERDDLLLKKARALVMLERRDEADELLEGFGDMPAAVSLRAELAEKRAEWDHAMALYRTLPEDHPQRAEGLRRSQLRWRLSIQPRYVQEALASPALSRAELAVVLVAVAPGLETAAAGRVPVLSDIVDLPSQREVITVVRNQLLQVDPLEHRFFPHREARPEEVKDAVEALTHLLGFTQPRWCPDTEAAEKDGSCYDLLAPISGEELAELVLDLAEASTP